MFSAALFASNFLDQQFTSTGSKIKVYFGHENWGRDDHIPFVALLSWLIITRKASVIVLWWDFSFNPFFFVFGRKNQQLIDLANLKALLKHE